MELNVLLDQNDRTIHKMKKDIGEKSLLNNGLLDLLGKPDFKKNLDKVKYMEATDQILHLRKENEKSMRPSQCSKI